MACEVIFSSNLFSAKLRWTKWPYGLVFKWTDVSLALLMVVYEIASEQKVSSHNKSSWKLTVFLKVIAKIIILVLQLIGNLLLYAV